MNNDKVINLPCITYLDLPAERILEMAEQKGLAEVVVIGFDKDGEYYFASSKSDGANVLWLLELTKKKLFETEGKL
jgi:hypothetical protein